MTKCPGVPHAGHASSDWTCPRETGEDRRQAAALVSITLSEEDQDRILAREQDYSRNFASLGNPWTFLAEKIRRAQEDLWTDELRASPDMTPCGRCGALRHAHQDSRPEPDHIWQWARPVKPVSYSDEFPG